MKTVRDNGGVRVEDAAACYLCTAAGNLLYESLRDGHFGAPGTWSLRQCRDPECALAWLDPVPSEADVHKVYASYFTHDPGAGEARPAEVRNGLRRTCRAAFRGPYHLLLHLAGVYRARFDLATMYLATESPGRLLDVGCGNGVFLDRMRSMGWDVHGVEADPRAARVARERFASSVFVGVLEEARHPGDHFDAITAHHVVEHVRDPVALLGECRRILKPGGRLLLVTPNVRSLGHARFGRSWRGLEPPRHLYLFSESTLARVAERAGLRTIETWTTSARAEAFARGSIESSSPSILAELRSKWFMWRALAHHSRSPGSGEELVLRAAK